MSNMSRKIAIASDHGGYELKEDLKGHLLSRGFEIVDMGAGKDESVDYPDFGALVAEAVSKNEFERGILLCGTGIGMSIVANKFKGVRAALVSDVFSARMAKEHNNANVIVVGGRVTGKELARAVVDAWLDTEYRADERHRRRLEKIAAIEKKQCEGGHRR
jgi:ribose 5-phosphate isomerase B